MTGPGITRRELLRRGGIGAAALGLGGVLAACGAGDDTPSFEDEPSGVLNFANRPFAIDKEPLPSGRYVRPSIEAFTRRKGVLVNYREVIPSADAFFRQIEPFLASGQPTGWDLVVITSGLALTRMIELGYLVELPADRRPNFDRYASELVRDPTYDPGNQHTMASQSGITGLAYDPTRTGRPVTSLADLFSPEFEGKVGMFEDVVDTPNVALLAAGITPERSTEEDWLTAAGLLIEQRDSGVLAGYYQQEYVGALGRGGLAITMARSGDILAAKVAGDLPEHVEFVVPSEGGLLWTDCLCIPQGAANLPAAISYMDYVYEPPVAAQIAQYVNSITPVPEAQAEIVRMAEESQDALERERLLGVAESPLVFPTDDLMADLYPYRALESPEEAEVWEETFHPVFQG